MVASQVVLSSMELVSSIMVIRMKKNLINANSDKDNDNYNNSVQCN
jgi:hypothetical protein